jgi:hypothetical protein
MPEFNMPPGVSVNDIPGNRPEDLAEEAWWEKLGEICPDVPEEIWDDERVQKLVESARDLAYSTGYQEGRADEQVAEAGRESESVEPQPQAVYVIEGWFGDQEWIEAVYATKEAADAKTAELWKTRESEHPGKPVEHARGLHKFAVVTHKVLP